MREAETTTRERIAAHLRETTATPSALAAQFDVTASLAVDHVRHVARSLDDEQLLVAPPECEECGFSDFDDPANRPSRCPECKHESLTEPHYKIE
ncbi:MULTISPECIES: transcriptional regulator [Halorussus]|uniref:transcriptional regulator n=1 Tax=Halorussus TaxID=1070314 RepID=UPI0020A13283|nr:transcriptional regulator [Halorussus vallis]USZ75252.1 transcriptional regulator [Halorussus vallis]